MSVCPLCAGSGKLGMYTCPDCMERRMSALETKIACLEVKVNDNISDSDREDCDEHNNRCD